MSCIYYILQPSQEVTLELTDDTWPRKVERAQPVSTKQQPSRYMFIHKNLQVFCRFYMLECLNWNCLCWSRSVVDVPLQPLDARSLLAARAVLQTASQREKSIASSTPLSSLDLEWEHEGMFWVLFFPPYKAVCWYISLIDKGWWTFSLLGSMLT